MLAVVTACLWTCVFSTLGIWLGSGAKKTIMKKSNEEWYGTLLKFQPTDDRAFVCSHREKQHIQKPESDYIESNLCHFMVCLHLVSLF